jgi:hypothetical protein
MNLLLLGLLVTNVYSVTFSWNSSSGITNNVFYWWNDCSTNNYNYTNLGTSEEITVPLSGNEPYYNWTVDSVDTNGYDNWPCMWSVWYSPCGQVLLTATGMTNAELQSTYDLSGETSYWTDVSPFSNSIVWPVSPVQFFRLRSTNGTPSTLHIQVQ